MQTQTPTSAKGGQMWGTVATTNHKPFQRGRTFVTLGLIVAAVLLIAAISIPNLLRSRMAADQAAHYSPTRYQAAEKLVDGNAGAALASPALTDLRQVIATASMHLTVADPAAALEQVTALSREAGGFVESSELYRSASEITGANVTIRVPASRFEAARAEVRRLGRRVERESANSRDVTAQFVDMKATLRNYQAEEAQYLGIMREARNVKDTLEVAQRLSDARGRIERAQAQLNLMSRQVEMASIAITLRAEEGPAGNVSWSPLHELRAAWNDSLQGFADYINLMFVVLLRIPLVLAWSFTVCALAALAWRIVRWIWQHWFARAPVPQAAL